MSKSGMPLESAEGGKQQTEAHESGAAGASNGSERRTLTANQLRRLAEWADGVRGVTLQMVVDDQGARLEQVRDFDEVPPGTVLISTESRNPNRKIPARVDVIKPSTGKPHSLDTKRFDAVCWSEAALEKFFVPYYVRFYSEEEFAKLRNAFSTGEVIAVAHIYPTFWEDIPDGERNTPLFRDNTADDAVYVLKDTSELIESGFQPLSTWLQNR